MLTVNSHSRNQLLHSWIWEMLWLSFRFMRFPIILPLFSHLISVLWYWSEYSASACSSEKPMLLLCCCDGDFCHCIQNMLNWKEFRAEDFRFITLWCEINFWKWLIIPAQCNKSLSAASHSWSCISSNQRQLI